MDLKLSRKTISRYQSLPKWAQKELAGCACGWEETDYEELGWEWSVFEPAVILNSKNRIPSNVVFYFNLIRGIVSGEVVRNKISSMPADAVYPEPVFNVRKDGRDFVMEVEFLNLDGKTKLTSRSKNKIEAALGLYQEVVVFYEESYLPGLCDLTGVENTFLDRDGHLAVELKNFQAAEEIYRKYSRFVEQLFDESIYPGTPNYMNYKYYNGLAAGMGEEHRYFDLRLMEGVCRFYTNYGEYSSMAQITLIPSTTTTIDPSIYVVPNSTTTSPNFNFPSQTISISNPDPNFHSIAPVITTVNLSDLDQIINYCRLP